MIGISREAHTEKECQEHHAQRIEEYLRKEGADLACLERFLMIAD